MTFKSIFIILIILPHLGHSLLSYAGDNSSTQKLDNSIEQTINTYHKSHLALVNKIVGRYDISSFVFVAIGSSPAVVIEYIKSLGGQVYYFPISDFGNFYTDKTNRKTIFRREMEQDEDFKTHYTHEKLVGAFAANIEKRIPDIKHLDRKIVLIDYTQTGESIENVHYFFEQGLKRLGIAKRLTKVHVALFSVFFNFLPRISTKFSLPFFRTTIFGTSLKLENAYAERRFSSLSKYKSFNIVFDPAKRLRRKNESLIAIDKSGHPIPIENGNTNKILSKVILKRLMIKKSSTVPRKRTDMKNLWVRRNQKNNKSSKRKY